MAVLVGDVGGTKTVLAVYDDHHGLVWKARFESRKHRSFEQLLREFLKGHAGPFSAACFGAPGPVIDGKVKTTHLPWLIDARKLRALLGCPVALLNDVELAAHGLPHLLPIETVLVSKTGPGRHQATKAVVMPGTGLGEAVLLWTGTHHDVLPSEGGHADLAPRVALEWDLKVHLERDLGYTGTEAVLSGRGLLNLYAFLQSKRFAREDPRVTDLIKREGPAAITEAAERLHDPLCTAAIELFVDILAEETQRVALSAKALGGVYLAGSIAHHLLDHIRKPRFMKVFLANRRMRGLLERIPVHVVRNPDLPLLGAAHFARTRAR